MSQKSLRPYTDIIEGAGCRILCEFQRRVAATRQRLDSILRSQQRLKGYTDITRMVLIA